MPTTSSVELQWPGSRADHVLRGTLCDRIASPGIARVVLVRAPAGFGKTTAMQQARERLESEGATCAWLTLERADNDASRFLARLAETVGWLSASALEDHDVADPARVLQHLSGRIALFMDDVEQLQDPTALAQLRRLIDKLPRGGLLVLGSRVHPELGLARLRVQGLLAEIDTADLRFSLANTTEFLRLRGLGALPAALMADLHHKTEGWVAALWLASLALERHGAQSDFVARFSGTERSVAEYLAEEVLEQQSAQVREFLLRTSIARELTLPLAQALNPRMDCAAIVARLEGGSIFLTPVPTPGHSQAWRYHSLFAEFLQSRLARERPDDAIRLHLTAAAWYEAEGRSVPAIDHLIEAGDHPQALALLEANAETFLAHGRMRLLARWFAALGPSALQGQPRLQMIAAWAACFTQGPWEAWRQLEEAESNVERADSLLQAHSDSLRPLLLSMMDRFEEAYEVGRASLARLPSAWGTLDRRLVNTMASVAAVMGEHREAQRLLETARTSLETSRFEHSFTEGMQALLDLQDGRLREAKARFRLALKPGSTTSEGANLGSNAWVGVLYVSTVYELGNIDRAEELLDVYLPLARSVGLPDHMILSHTLRARIAFHRGNIEAAFETLAELEVIGHRRQLPRVTAAAHVERSWMLVLQKNSKAAREELERGDDPEVWDRVQRLRLPAHDTSDLLLGKLRWEVHFGDPRLVIQAIAAERDRCLNARQRRQCVLQVLMALALEKAGDHTTAISTLIEWLQTAAPQGSMRTLLDEGPLAAALLHRLHEQAPVALESPLLRDHLHRLMESAPAFTAEAANDLSPTPVLTESLTRKELRVLELLVEGYSNSGMAEKLFVSESTVRTHLRNINQKTGARNRTQAVAIARRIGIIR